MSITYNNVVHSGDAYDEKRAQHKQKMQKKSLFLFFLFHRLYKAKVGNNSVH